MIVCRLGYDITTDLHHGFTLIWRGRYGWLLAFHWNWPNLVWYNRDWAMDEAGYIQGMPVYRRKPKKWLLRSINWPMRLECKRL